MFFKKWLFMNELLLFYNHTSVQENIEHHKRPLCEWHENMTYQYATTEKK